MSFDAIRRLLSRWRQRRRTRLIAREAARILRDGESRSAGHAWGLDADA